jgi:hypothetical protein
VTSARCHIVRRTGIATVLAVAMHAPLAPAQTLQSLSSSKNGNPTVDVFAEGNVKNVISQPSDATSVSGALGMRYLGTRFIISGLINVAGSSDTVTSGWGATMLAPATGSTLNAGLLDLRIRRRDAKDPGCAPPDPSLFCNQSIHLYSTIGSRRWATRIDTTLNAGAAPTLRVSETFDVPVWGIGADYSIAFFDGSVPMGGESANVAMVLDAGLATRHIRGDLFARELTRARVLSSSQLNFWGPEVVLSMQVNQIRSSLAYYYMSGSVDGFSRGQVVAGVSISARLGGGEFTPR